MDETLKRNKLGQGLFRNKSEQTTIFVTNIKGKEIKGMKLTKKIGSVTSQWQRWRKENLRLTRSVKFQWGIIRGPRIIQATSRIIPTFAKHDYEEFNPRTVRKFQIRLESDKTPLKFLENSWETDQICAMSCIRPYKFELCCTENEHNFSFLYISRPHLFDVNFHDRIEKIEHLTDIRKQNQQRL